MPKEQYDAPNPRGPPVKPTQQTRQESRLWNSTKQTTSRSSQAAEFERRKQIVLLANNPQAQMEQVAQAHNQNKNQTKNTSSLHSSSCGNSVANDQH